MARQNFLGQVISQGCMNKTVKVRVFHKKYDRRVQKEFQVKKDYLVHDEANICREGDLVRIEATRPLSSRKFFAVAEIKKNQGQQFATYQEEAKIAVANEENEKNREFLARRALVDKNANESLYADLNTIKELQFKSELTTEELETIKNLKAKYGITSWTDTPYENKEVFTSSITHLASKIDSLSKDVALAEKLNTILANEQLLEEFASKAGANVETKNNIKKNLIRKYLKENPVEW